MYYLPPDTANRIRVERLAGATFDTVQDYINFFGDRVIITGGGITATLPADGTVAVAPCTAWCKETDSDTAIARFFDFAGIGNIALTDLSANILYLDYNAGTPQVIVATSYLTFGFQQDHTLLGAVYRDGNAVHIVNSDRLGIQGINRTHLQLVEHGARRTSGMLTLAAGVRNLTITAGVSHLGLIRVITPARDTTPAGGDTFTYWYYDGSLPVPAWVEVPGATQISDTQYNNVAAGLVALTPNRYGVHWVFMDFDGHLHVVYGQGDYTPSQAENANVPAVLPNLVLMFSVIVAKIICREATDVLTITYPWTIPFTSAMANDHSLLANLAADDHPQYIRHALATAISDFLVAPGAGTFVKQTVAQVRTLLNFLIIDTKTNILALTPANNPLAFATDVKQFYLYDGSGWRQFPIVLGTMPVTDIDMGAIPYSRDWGYKQRDLSSKILHNVRFGGFTQGQLDLQNGAVRYNDPNLEVRIANTWKYVRALTTAEVSDIPLWSDFTGAVAANGNEVIHHHEVDMGAMPTDHIQDGGTITNL